MKNTFNVLALFLFGIVHAQINLDSYQSAIANQYNFGKAVAAFNNTVICASGSPFLPTRGKLEIFNATDSGLTSVQTLQPTDGDDGDNYGYTLDMNDDYIAVGAPLYDSQFSNSGAVYVYKKTNGYWSLLQKIVPIDGMSLANFGYTVKIYEDQLFVCARYHSLFSNSSGKIYIYNLSQTTAELVQEWHIQGRNGLANTLSLNLGKLVVSYTQSATKYIETFSKTASSWISEGRFALDAPDYYFRNLRLDGDHLYLQLSDDTDTETFIRVYKSINNNWEYESEIELTKLNYSISDFEVSGNHMIIGYGFSSIGGKSPAAFYKKVNDAWVLQEFLFGNADSSDSDSFGANISFNNGKVYIGAPAEGATSAGKIYYSSDVLNSENFDFNPGIFPNPTFGNLTISDTPVKYAEIYNSIGQQVLQQHIPLQEISLEGLQNGLYIIKLSDDHGRNKTYKIVKK